MSSTIAPPQLPSSYPGGSGSKRQRPLGPAPVVFVLFSLTTVMWLVVGFAFWIPLLVRATATVGIAVLYCAFTEADPEKATDAFHLSATFYARGFALIHGVFYPGDSIRYSASESNKEVKWAAFAMEVVWTFVFWSGIVLGTAKLFRASPAIPSIQGRLSDTFFFEAGDTTPAPGKRLYETEFNSASTRFVNLELHFSHPALVSPVEIPITCRIIFPDGTTSKFSLNEVYRASQGDTAGSVLVGAAGNKAPGAFDPGTYVPKCSAEGHLFRAKSFHIAESRRP